MESLERLQGLYADLVAFSETRLAHIDRLWQELEDSIDEFRSLLDKSQTTAAAKEAFTNKKIFVHEQEYSTNDEFRHLSAAIANVLNIDEVEAGRWLIETQVSGEDVDEQIIIAEVVNKFHDRRDLLLQSLRITIEQSQNLEHDPVLKARFEEAVAHVLDIKNGPPSNGSAFAQKCLKSMEDIELWQTKVNEQIQSKAILSKVRGNAFYATFEFQRGSLFKQHEALGVILAYLFKGNYTISEDLRKLHNASRKWQRLDFQWTHYLPAFSAAFRQYGAPEGSTTPETAKSLNSALVTTTSTPTQSTSLRPFTAVLDMLWTAEYSGFSRDMVQDREAVREADGRARTVKRALDDGGLELMLSICANIHPEIWRQPARHELITILLDGSSLSWEAIEQSSAYFTNTLMDCFESFAEAWITNMPDSIRKLKNEEDDQRLSQLTALNEELMPTKQQQQVARMHLESFMVLIAFAVQQRPEAAEQFWADPDGNLYGFVQWASRRQTVPRASAFCEMISALSETPETAESAHKFLLDESIAMQNARGRRMPTMSYQQILAELEYYARKVHERSPATQVPKSRSQNEPEHNESESPIMLSCYLRLLGHLCRHTSSTRFYILGESGLDLPRSLLTLSSGPIPSYLRATIFSTVEALLTDKDTATSDRIWQTLDEWASTTHDKAPGNTQQTPNPTLISLQGSLAAIASSHDQSDAFVKLLRTLIWPLPEASGQPLPFPQELGSNYRSPGISPYVDFVCAQITPKRVREQSEESNGQVLLRCFNCLDFIGAGLNGFNENFVTKLERSSTQLGSEADYSTIYGQRHPFTRIMQWLFSIDLNKALMLLLEEPTDKLVQDSPEAPTLNNLQRTIEIVIAVLEFQPTFFDVIRPKIKATDTQKAIPYTGFTSIEESIVANPSVIAYLCQYAATEHTHLALKSLALLQKLAASSKLQNYHTDEKRSVGRTRRLIEMLGPTGELEIAGVAQALAAHFKIDERELEAGFESDGYLMKDGTLAFIHACLSTSPGSPNLAHLLLGFHRLGERLAISSQIDEGISLLNATSRLGCELPDAQNDSLLSWLIHLKSAALNVLQILWSSPLSSEITMGQLRRARFMQAQFASQTIVSQASAWDGLSVLDLDFWKTTSAEGFAQFLSLRSSLYDYVAQELRGAASDRLQSLQQQYLTTLQGKTVEGDGNVVNHPSIFDLFDFAELDTDASLGLAELRYFHHIDYEAYKREASEDLPKLYDIAGINVVLNRMYLQICNEFGQAGKQADEEGLITELDYVLGLLDSRNRYNVAQRARIKALQSYVDMVISTIECCPMDTGPKTQFILHMLQLILPKLDVYMGDGAPETMQLTRAADALLHELSSNSRASTRSRMENMIADKLFQLFRVCAEGIPRSTTGPELRSLLYSICSEYLTRILSSDTADSETHSKARGNSMDCIRSVGTQLVATLADDAEDGLDSCRLNALNLLAQLVSISRSEKSTFVLETLVKANILEVLLDPVKEVAAEFQATDPTNRPYLISIFESRMIFFLQLSRTRAGASALLDAGFMQAMRDSFIFRADPDLGMDLDSSTTTNLSLTNGNSIRASDPAASALHNYFLLLSATLRVLLSTFTSIGPQNEKMIYLTRNFLADYRANMVGIFKKAVGVNGKITNSQSRRVLEECVRCYTGLAVGCGFLGFEDSSFVDGMNDATGNAYTNGQGVNASGSFSNGGRGFT